MEITKGWGADSAKRAAGAAQLAGLKAKKVKAPKADARTDFENRAWGKMTRLTERSNAGQKISPIRPRSFSPLESQLPGYGGRTGSNWKFDGNKRVRKSMTVSAFGVEH